MRDPDGTQERFEHAMAQPGWYMVFKTADGLRRVPVTRFEIGEEIADTGMTECQPELNVPLGDVPFDLLGGLTSVGCFHPSYKPEPEGLA